MSPLLIRSAPWLCVLLLALPPALADQCQPNDSRGDCAAGLPVNQQSCEQKGCCWTPVNPNPQNLPWCYQKTPPAGSSCFVLLDTPAESAPFDTAAVSLITKHFLANINVNGTGAVVASPGAVPALNNCCPGGYSFHWMRDGALSMDTFQQLEGIGQPLIQSTMEAYISWVSKMQAQESSAVDAHTEPKWNIRNETPYSGGWCRPQTDGPGLRARALMRYASTLQHDQNKVKEDLWKLISFDLDWLSESKESTHELGCDLWEETTANDLLWNKVTQRAALDEGAKFASLIGDHTRATTYERAADGFIGDPFATHLDSQSQFLTECPAMGGSDACKKYDKLVDGAVILSLIHSGWLRNDTRMQLGATSISVAKTVQQYTSLFCSIYAVNQQDAKDGVPGVLYGRYKAD